MHQATRSSFLADIWIFSISKPRALYFVSQESNGGKLHVFMSSLPKIGSKALSMREQNGLVNGTQPLTVMEPASKEFRELGEDAAQNMVSLL